MSIQDSNHRCSLNPTPPREDAEAALHDARRGRALEVALAVTPVDGTRQAKSQGRERAAGAQQLRALRVVAAPRLQRRELKRARRQRECEWSRRLQVMRAHAAEVEDGASGSGAQHDRRNLTNVADCLRKEEGMREGSGEEQSATVYRFWAALLAHEDVPAAPAARGETMEASLRH
jgi:hypothetical protein